MIDTDMRILVFDSGIGGQAVAERLEELLPHVSVTSINDHEHMPYGEKTSDEIFNLTKNAIQPYIYEGYSVIVIACNTVTTNAITRLRSRYPSVNFIGIEPMVKPASALSSTKTIAVCATPSTLKSSRYTALKHKWLENFTVIEPDCQSWAELIENGKSSEIDLITLMNSLIMQNVDVIVLGCTHYHWLRQRMINAAPAMMILEPSDALARRINDILR